MAAVEKQRQELELNLSQSKVVVEGLQEQNTSLKVDLVKRNEAKEGAEAEAASLGTRCDELALQTDRLAGVEAELRVTEQSLSSVNLVGS